MARFRGGQGDAPSPSKPCFHCLLFAVKLSDSIRFARGWLSRDSYGRERVCKSLEGTTNEISTNSPGHTCCGGNDLVGNNHHASRESAGPVNRPRTRISNGLFGRIQRGLQRRFSGGFAQPSEQR